MILHAMVCRWVAKNTNRHGALPWVCMYVLIHENRGHTIIEDMGMGWFWCQSIMVHAWFYVCSNKFTMKNKRIDNMIEEKKMPNNEKWLQMVAKYKYNVNAKGKCIEMVTQWNDVAKTNPS